VRIVSEERRKAQVRPRPRNGDPHAWSRPGDRESALYLASDVAKAVGEESARGARAGKEALGLLLGDWFADREGVPFSVAGALVTAPLEATRTHVRFDAAKFTQLAREMERVAFEHIIVGWFHTHLGLGCGLSPTDMATQRRYFAAAHQVTWVVDPELESSEAYVLRAGAPAPRGVFVLRADAARLGEYLRPRGAKLPPTREPDTSR